MTDSDLERAARLTVTTALTQREFDQRKANYEVAKAQLRRKLALRDFDAAARLMPAVGAAASLSKRTQVERRWTRLPKRTEPNPT